MKLRYMRIRSSQENGIQLHRVLEVLNRPLNWLKKGEKIKLVTIRIELASILRRRVPLRSQKLQQEEVWKTAAVKVIKLDQNISKEKVAQRCIKLDQM